jgi:hypothetical protein
MHLKNQHSKEMEEKEKVAAGMACSHPDAALELCIFAAELRTRTEQVDRVVSSISARAETGAAASKPTTEPEKPAATPMRVTQKQPRTILNEWCQKKKVPSARFQARPAPDGKEGFICKVRDTHDAVRLVSAAQGVRCLRSLAPLTAGARWFCRTATSRTRTPCCG